MNFKVLFAFLLLTVALTSAAPIEAEEKEPTLSDEEGTGETYEETFDERGFPIKREVNNESIEEASTETPVNEHPVKRETSESPEDTTTEEPGHPIKREVDEPSEESTTESAGQPAKREADESSEEATTETTTTENRDGREAFNADLVNIMIDAVDGAVDVAVGAVTGAVDVALGTVTGAANVAAGTVNGAMGIVSSTVDGTLNIISTTVNKGPRPSNKPQASPPAHQPAYPTFATPQLASPAQPIVSRPITAPQEMTNIIGTPTGPITSNAVTRDMTNGESVIITAEETPSVNSFTLGTTMSFEEALPVANTKPAVIESVVIANAEEIASVETPITEPIISNEGSDDKFTPIISPIIVESINTPNMETGFTPIEARNTEDAVESTDMASALNIETVITEETAETSDDDVIREKRAPHDHKHEDHTDCDDHSSHETDQ